MGVEFVEGEGAVITRKCNEWGLCGVIVLCREGWQRSSSQMILETLVVVVAR